MPYMNDLYNRDTLDSTAAPRTHLKTSAYLQQFQILDFVWADKGDYFTLVKDFPGVSPEDVDVSIQRVFENSWRVEIAVKANRKGSENFSCDVRIPIDASKASGKMEHGRLTLTVPKAASYKKVVVPINV